ncbi:MAG TPA: hypothetical protein VG897_09045 [Terriglobales bacterium]|nr:hypothetical protein [Terriglobales bacterium]
MSYDLVLGLLTAAFPVMGFVLFLIFWKLSRNDVKPDPIYDPAPTKH